MKELTNIYGLTKYKLLPNPSFPSRPDISHQIEPWNFLQSTDDKFHRTLRWLQDEDDSTNQAVTFCQGHKLIFAEAINHNNKSMSISWADI